MRIKKITFDDFLLCAVVLCCARLFLCVAGSDSDLVVSEFGLWVYMMNLCLLAVFLCRFGLCIFCRESFSFSMNFGLFAVFSVFAGFGALSIVVRVSVCGRIFFSCVVQVWMCIYSVRLRLRVCC